MKALLILDDATQEIDVALFDVSYNKHVGYDLTILIESSELYQKKQKETVSASRPSLRGIAEANSGPITLERAVEGTDLKGFLLSQRQESGIKEVTPVTSVGLLWDEIITQEYSVTAIGALREAITELVEKEKEYIQERGIIYSVEQTVIATSSEDPNRFWLTEKLMVRKKEEYGKSPV